MYKDIIKYEQPQLGFLGVDTDLINSAVKRSIEVMDHTDRNLNIITYCCVGAVVIYLISYLNGRKK